ncbi:MAG: T9SS type A sorting domain-containing protein [Schleiferiaceae bacterium]|nr:T9SS type A sorting domain-containing protein [Schleiferiaceae bacterium]
MSMKHTTLIMALAFGSMSAFAQNADRTAPMERTVADDVVKHLTPAQMEAIYGAETPVWSEDFASGIPSTWLTSGGTANGASDTDAVWVYRGTATTPNNTVGSRGGYAGAAGTAQYPITSATASNGFVIFDSDFLDNAGIAGNFGNGIAPSAQVASMVTDMIDLTNYTVIDLMFTQYYRRFAGPGSSQAVPATYVDFSTDGGATFPNSVTLNSAIAVNSSTASNDIVTISAGSMVGGHDSVKVRFRWDGDYYYWQIDDISIINTPANRLSYTDYNGAPAQDIVFGPASGSSRMGITSLKQARSMSFDCNIINSGSAAQSNVKLTVNIFNSSGSNVQSLSSTTISTMAAGDTANWNTLNTYATAWTPSAEDAYTFLYTVTSDSATAVSDTFNFFVTDSLMSMDFNSWDNSIGASSNTTQWGDGAQMNNRHDLVGDEMLWGTRVYLSSATTAGAILEIGVYDSSAFDGSTGMDPNKLVAYGQRVITTTDTAQGFVRFDFTDPTTGRGVDLLNSNGAYFYNLTMYDNQGGDHIRIRNDQSWGKVSGSGYMYLAALGNWYSGYSGSRSFNNLWIRAIACPAANAAACMTTSLDEGQLEGITLMPNPANDIVHIDFGMAMGEFNVTLIDMTGKVVKAESMLASSDSPVYVGDLNAGMYMVQVQQADVMKTFKLSVY